MTPEQESEQHTPAMSAQQQRFTATHSPFETYRELVVGDKGWGSFAAFELYNLMFCNMPSALGIAARSLFAPRLLKRCGRGVSIGKSVTIRQPARIALGNRVILDDSSVLDVRAESNAEGDCGIQIGNHVVIGRGSIVAAKAGFVSLADACNVSSYCRIATQSRVEIGESVLIAAYAYIGPGNHQVDSADKPIIEQTMDIKGGVFIGDHTWIGTRVTVLDGVRIGKGAVIGAHSLVTSDIPDNAIAVGTPAKVIRYRD